MAATAAQNVWRLQVLLLRQHTNCTWLGVECVQCVLDAAGNDGRRAACTKPAVVRSVRQLSAV